MKVLQFVEELASEIVALRAEGKCIGFVPTMGALHEGHLSLVNISKEQCDITVCSIFVNPTQFNEIEDLESYPKTLDEDKKKLKAAHTDILFYPGVEEVYPPGLSTLVNVDFSDLDKVMEGVFRPGHFEGMAQVVKRLLDIVQPDLLFMGQKDFQQAAIVQHMINTLQLNVELVICPIMREAHGLAMSSRNVRLSELDRMRAGQLFKALCYLQSDYLEGVPLETAVENAKSMLKLPGFKLEYLEVVDTATLKKVENWKDAPRIIVCVACWVGEVRLIDNKYLN